MQRDITGIINANTDIIDTLQEDKFYNDTQKLLARRSYDVFLKDIPKIETELFLCLSSAKITFQSMCRALQ